MRKRTHPFARLNPYDVSPPRPALPRARWPPERFSATTAEGWWDGVANHQHFERENHKKTKGKPENGG